MPVTVQARPRLKATISARPKPTRWSAIALRRTTSAEGQGRIPAAMPTPRMPRSVSAFSSVGRRVVVMVVNVLVAMIVVVVVAVVMPVVVCDGRSGRGCDRRSRSRSEAACGAPQRPTPTTSSPDTSVSHG